MKISRILVIDDEDDIRGLIQTCLELVGGWQVVTASSGAEGLIKAETEQPDAILLDMMMPEIDGLATLQKLQSNQLTKHIAVILLTAKGRAIAQSQLAQLNVKGIISKPFKPLDLANQITALLDKTHLEPNR
ncbi:MAG: response regulator [Leptolyngbyaceae cyanobacterium SU_3_3]|nr:response regulator [Leptolyngbyaceae cyanobacterium SU_3_3]NJR49673.1 response regulator [Leptolyngbyaceae cyanobacterium CSU_1_3]